MNQLTEMTLIQSLVNTATGNTTYADYIPEGVDLPAQSIVHIAPEYTRVVNGDISGVRNNWRLTLMSNDTSELRDLLDIIDGLDNTDDAELGKVRFELEQIETKGTDSTVRRAFYIIQTNR